MKEVELSRNELVLSYRHPVTGRIEELVLHVDSQTGFSEGTRLENLHVNDPVSVDYVDGVGKTARAIRVGRVPLKGVPFDKAPF